jgi:hypothetical protein
MLELDQAPWGRLIAEQSVDPGFAEEFASRLGRGGGWNMAGVIDWEDPPQIVETYQLAHRANSARLRAILGAVGWPTRSLVGADGVDAAWVLLHHFGDGKFQREALARIVALPPGERDLKHYAFTEDLVRRVEGLVPRFGTMGLPVEEPDGLDDLRRQFDLPSLASQEASRAAGLVVLPAGVGRATPGMGWPTRPKA